MLQQLQVGCEDAVWSLQERSELGEPWGLPGLYFWKLGTWKYFFTLDRMFLGLY